MPEPQSSVVTEEKPVVPTVVEERKPQLSEQEITDTYVEKRLRRETEDLPVPPPTIPERQPEKPVEQAELPLTPEAVEIKKVDEYLDERKIAKERKKKGGAQARIDQLTKEKAELEAKLAATPTPEPQKPVPTQPEPTKPPEPEVAKIPTKQPRMNEYETADDYQAALALWAASEATKTAAIPAKVEPVVQPTIQVRKEEFDKFLDNGKRFVSIHPDFNATLEAAHIRGLTMSEPARIAITRLAAPEVAYWLAKPENDLAARTLMSMDDFQQVIEVGKIAERLRVSPTDFVSNAPQPGIRLQNGNTRSTVPLSDLDTDDYIRMRKQEKAARRGR